MSACASQNVHTFECASLHLCMCMPDARTPVSGTLTSSVGCRGSSSGLTHYRRRGTQRLPKQRSASQTDCSESGGPRPTGGFQQTPRRPAAFRDRAPSRERGKESGAGGQPASLARFPRLEKLPRPEDLPRRVSRDRAPSSERARERAHLRARPPYHGRLPYSNPNSNPNPTLAQAPTPNPNLTLTLIRSPSLPTRDGQLSPAARLRLERRSSAGSQRELS